MNVAVGRLQMTVRWNRQAETPASRDVTLSRLSRAERAYERQRLAQQLDAERAHWLETIHRSWCR